MRIAVVGAGIAGLTCAEELAAAGAEVVVLESSDRVGGKLLLAEVGGVQVDQGAESMLARRPEGLDLVERLGLGDRLVHPEPGPARLWTRGALRPMPPTVMGVPADLEALADSGVLAEPVRPRSVPVSDHDISVGEYVAERVGQEVVDRLVEPLLGGVYAGHADRLSLQAAAPAISALGADPVAAAISRRSASVSSGPMLAGLRGGIGSLPMVLAERLDVRLGCSVRTMSHDGGGWTLVMGSTTAAIRESFDAVVLAVPAPAASRLLAEAAAEASFLLSGVEYASMALVTLVTEGAELPTGSGFLVPAVDGRAIKAATFATGKWAWIAEQAAGAAVIRLSLGRAGEAMALQRGDQELTELAVADLSTAIAGQGTVGDIVASRVQRWGGGLPQYEVGHLDLVSRVESDAASVPGLALCGAAYHGVGIPAVIASARRAARAILSQETMTT